MDADIKSKAPVGLNDGLYLTGLSPYLTAETAAMTALQTAASAAATQLAVLDGLSGGAGTITALGSAFVAFCTAMMSADTAAHTGIAKAVKQMKSIALETRSTKFAVENHHWRFTKNRAEYLAQKIRHTISVFQGEWFMDRSIGIPYIPGEDVEKYMHRRMIETALQVRIGVMEGVEMVLSFSSAIDTETRICTVDFTVQIDTGETYRDVVEIGV
jgi:hypothetical protein